MELQNGVFVVLSLSLALSMRGRLDGERAVAGRLAADVGVAASAVATVSLLELHGLGGQRENRNERK